MGSDKALMAAAEHKSPLQFVLRRATAKTRGGGEVEDFQDAGERGGFLALGVGGGGGVEGEAARGSGA